MSGDPDAREIARQYKTSPLNPTKPILRQVERTTRDAAEAEAKVGAVLIVALVSLATSVAALIVAITAA